MDQDIEFPYVVVRYDSTDYRLAAVVVAYATSLQEGYALQRCFADLAPQFAPLALYAVRTMREVLLCPMLYQSYQAS